MPTNRSARIHASAAVAAALVASLLQVGPVSAFPQPVCSTVTPALEQQVACSGDAGTIDVTVPAGAVTVSVVVAGAGGGAATSLGGGSAGGSGGTGARVTAQIDVTGRSTMRVVVGAGGAEGAATGTRGGAGGGYSAIFTGASSAPVDALVVAGGGGGGGASTLSLAGGSGAAAGTPAGGNGAGLNLGGYGAPGDGTGGLGGGGCPAAASNGAAWSSGGAGGGGVRLDGGDGGAGYGGGGEGTSDGAGGAGGSFALAAAVIGSASYDSSGGSGGVGMVNGLGSAGTRGSVTLVFHAVAVNARTSEATAEVRHALSWRDGATTTQTSGVQGTWVFTPAAGQSPTPGARLLGWATSPNFPVALAQTLGAAFDDTVNGQRMIFIPAGRPTFLSGDNTLHAVWGSGVRLFRC